MERTMWLRERGSPTMPSHATILRSTAQMDRSERVSSPTSLHPRSSEDQRRSSTRIGTKQESRPLSLSAWEARMVYMPKPPSALDKQRRGQHGQGSAECSTPRPSLQPGPERDTSTDLVQVADEGVHVPPVPAICRDRGPKVRIADAVHQQTIVTLKERDHFAMPSGNEEHGTMRSERRRTVVVNDPTKLRRCSLDRALECFLREGSPELPETQSSSLPEEEEDADRSENQGSPAYPPG